MKRCMNYLVIESQEDFDKHYDKNYKKLVHSNIDRIPDNFPICYKYREGWDTGMCGDWIECDIKEAINAWNKRIQESIDFVKRVEAVFNREEN